MSGVALPRGVSSGASRYWIRVITLIQALGAFFTGIYFTVWGNGFTSPPWIFIMAVPGGGAFWGSILLVSGALFLAGLEWDRSWPRVFACIVGGLVYGAIGIGLAIVPFFRESSLNGSVGIWFLASALTLCLAGFMRAMHLLAGELQDEADDVIERDKKK